MRTSNAIWSVLASTIILTGMAAQAAAADTDEQAVTAAEHQWLKSQQTNNTELLAPLLADKVMETNSEGKLIAGKSAVLADAKSESWSSADYKELKVTVSEHAAIATGIFVGQGKDAAGKPLESRERFTDTWVKTANGNWLCIASHTSAIKK